MAEDYTKNINADAQKVQKDNDKKTISKTNGKLKSAIVNDVISKRGRTVGGGRPDDIIINPPLKIMEASERHAVVAFGRMNPPTTGHEKLIHKVEDTAKEVGGEAHIIASHSENNPKNPVPSKAKVGYIKKVAKPETKVSASSKESPTLLHHLSNLHKSGVKHVTIVSDKIKEFGDLAHKYNGVEGKHGHYNFKSIKSVSSGMRDPDAEGAAGISGTKMREYAHAGDEKKFKAGLPKALHPHAKEIMGHITKTNESFNNAFELLADHSIDLIEESFKEIAGDITDITEKQYKALKEKSIKSGIDLDRLIEEYKFAYVLYQCAPHKNMTAEQWSFGAVNSLIANESSDAPWNHESPSKKHRKLTPAQKAKAKARARAAGRPYPNWVDNSWAVNEEIAINNSTQGGNVRGLGNVTGSPDGESPDYVQANIVDADTMDLKFKELNAMHVAMHDKSVLLQKDTHVDLHDKSTVGEEATFTDIGVPASVKLSAKKNVDKNDPLSRQDASDSLVSIYTNDTPGQKNKKVDVKELFVRSPSGKIITIKKQKFRGSDNKLHTAHPGKSGSSGGGGSGDGD
jgi:hypothetical protein